MSGSPTRSTQRRQRPTASRPFSVFLSYIFLFLFLVTTAPSRAQQPELSSDTAVETGREALEESGNYPWYDSSEDGVRRIELSETSDADSANRGSKWTRKPKATTGPRFPGGRVSLLGPIWQALGIMLLILALGSIAYLIIRAFLSDEQSDDHVRKVVETSRDVDRVEALPFQVRKPTGDFLAEARRLYEAGEYSEAIVYLFSYQLVQLDKHHVIRLTKGKTNRQYLREVRQRPALRAILETTMFAFEDAFFGRKRLTKEQFETCWNRVDEFHRELERLERAAA
jgi:hypothetical protein